MVAEDHRRRQLDMGALKVCAGGAEPADGVVVDIAVWDERRKVVVVIDIEEEREVAYCFADFLNGCLSIRLDDN